jgi:hypothetical protein
VPEECFVSRAERLARFASRWNRWGSARVGAPLTRRAAARRGVYPVLHPSFGETPSSTGYFPVKHAVQ